MTADHKDIAAATAEEKKEEGNKFYKMAHYPDALQCYTDAINLVPTCASYFANRSATYMMLNKYSDGLEDARRSVALDHTFIKGHLREGQCHLMLGDTGAAVRSYEQVLKLEPTNKTALTKMKVAQGLQNYESMAESDFQKGDIRRAVFCMDRCLEMTPGCLKFRIKKAEGLALLGRHQESQEIANDILQKDYLNADALFVRGLCLYYQDNIEKAFQHFQQVLKLVPDHYKSRDAYKKAKCLLATKEEGNKAFRAGTYTEAYKLYTKALEIDPNNKFTNSKLFFNRATVCSKISKLDEAIQDCTKAVELDDTYMKAFMRRAKCYMDTEQYDEAVRDYERVFKLDKSRENKLLLQNAKLELKKSKRKDYYKILGISKTATDDEIKKAYKKRALIHHPDRHSHDPAEVQKKEEVKFKEVGEAYGVLSDAKKRARYDNGQDLEDLDGMGFDNLDPTQIFATFFGNQFSFGGSGFPGGAGGFTFQFG